MAELDDKIMKMLLQTFRAEGAEHLQIMNQTLLQAERTESDTEQRNMLEEGFRAAHSLKGAARAVNMLEIEALTHDVESILQLAYKGQLEIDVVTADALYDAFDTLTLLVSGGEADASGVQAKLAGILSSHSEAGVNGNTVEQPYTDVMPAETEIIPSTGQSSEETIRVSIEKLDDLMAQVGELLVARINAEQRLEDMHQIRLLLERWPRLWREIQMLLPGIEGERGKHLTEILLDYAGSVQVVSKQFEHLDQQISRDARRLEMVANTLQEQVRHVRMVPFATLALILERTVRDAASSGGKDITFEIHGKQIELDKRVLETLKDPLLHLLRNAAYHGIELPDERERLGKSSQGNIEITVQQRGNEVRITVSDDGQGFDIERLQRLHAGNDDSLNGHNTSAEDQAIELAFMPGVSTSDEVNAIAGRGMGLDVVRQHIEGIRGRIQVETTAKVGTSFTITAPTSLAITRALLVVLGRERYVIPLLSVEKIVFAEQVSTVGGRLLLTVDDDRLPLYSLSAILERAASELPLEEQLALVISVGARRLAILVDDVLTKVELSVVPVGYPLRNVRNILGAAIMGNGEPVVVINPAHVIQSARGVQSPVVERPQAAEAEDTGPKASVLVVDDSITTRTLEKNILLMAGYDVTTATNGREALKALGEGDYDIVISDVQMPHMDGIELTRAIRSNNAYAHLPLILVTSLESKTDRERGLNAGANAYIVKRGFDQEVLLKTIGQLI
ncbi:MAG: response regulator [Chloroflexota bacterium]